MYSAARPAHGRLRWWLVLGLFLSVVPPLLLPAQGASAHSMLKSSTPETGSHIATMPTNIELTFVAAVKDVGVTVILADDQGDDWIAGPAAVNATLVSSPVKADIPDGRYEIRWSVISIDGAPMSGVVRFALGTVVEDTDPFETVLTAENVAWVRVTAFVGVGALLGFMAYGLNTVYGRRSRRRP